MRIASLDRNVRAACSLHPERLVGSPERHMTIASTETKNATPNVFAPVIEHPSELHCGRIGNLLLATTALRSAICRVTMSSVKKD